MSIIYSWLNPNKSELTKIEVYRSDTKDGEKTLIATLPGTATFYEDVGAPLNCVLYYSTIAYQGVASSVSRVMALASFENIGPGGSRLMRGDWEFGYFGTVPKELLPSYASLGTSIGSPTDGYANAQFELFHKWIINGNIVFIPNCPLNASGTTYQYLIDKKVAVPQNGDESNLLRLSLNGFTYRIRPPYLSNKLLSKVNDGSITVTGGVVSGADDTLATSEFAALIKSFLKSDPLGYFNSTGRMGDSKSLASYFNKFFWTGTWLTSVNIFTPGYAHTLDRSLAYGLTSTGILLWPMFILEQG